MRNVLLTWSLTSLLFTSVLLYCFVSGKIERSPANYLTEVK
jgi:hypothetical protein